MAKIALVQKTPEKAQLSHPIQFGAALPEVVLLAGEIRTAPRPRSAPLH